MSEKYYLRKNICMCCKRYDQFLIGISSIGWRFSFCIDDVHKNADDWTKEFVEPNKIFDGYDRELKFSDFINFIRSKRNQQSLSHLMSTITTDGEYDYRILEDYHLL